MLRNFCIVSINAKKKSPEHALLYRHTTPVCYATLVSLITVFSMGGQTFWPHLPLVSDSRPQQVSSTLQPV